MFVKHVRSQRRFNRSHSSSVLKIFVHSQFFVSILIIASYLCLTAVPAMIQTILILTSSHNTISEHVFYYVVISISLSTTADPLIYIFLKAEVRKLFFQKILCCHKTQSPTVHDKLSRIRRKGEQEDHAHDSKVDEDDIPQDCEMIGACVATIHVNRSRDIIRMESIQLSKKEMETEQKAIEPVNQMEQKGIESTNKTQFTSVL